ncbi:transglycosylase SLT domain-containing protein [Brucella anthropi]|jgi:soluble lytic murein transglycosylase-like protein|uniref:Lytic transglycosylase domain-containing protein n=1 Tax=Brucella anthropi TaxID=529 RepID=A0A6I0DPR7_BRUAN|nr:MULTISPECIES: lytic transglycosylase domain-containing protein [Brucella/Ochrobactrum group]QTN01722.1 transglycosylase SLT domain-containing protein [Ochrobactrum sp. EEELCW01]KAB2741158.1 lytic transglycosylase domain-containing protein [Brucella anthropi]KAB2759063.1 lytic transglycosylase domain-containing protein [Brucella anthropi]KAB2768695.1 lytic transglycosylase domain-containing protein [Brucella anthropi]KAB2801489.1 lytic transglycosylase domain-containing protein [Brucella ant
MRYALSSSSSAGLVRKGLMLLGCAVALSACNTTNDGKPVKTALITQTDTSSQTASAAGSAASATANTAGTATADAGAAAGTQTVAAVSDPSDPVLPAVVPIPGIRGQSEPMMAYAGAQAAASPASVAANMAFETPDHAPEELDALITKYSVAYDVPERLVRRVVHRESRFNPGARNGPYWGLMQISHPTARGMGYTGAAKGLLDAETNLKYAVRYLSGAYKVAGGDESQAVRYYARGYYYDAKRKGLLQETGLDGSWKRSGPTRDAAASIQPVSLPEGGAAPLPGVAPIQASYAPAGQ